MIPYLDAVQKIKDAAKKRALESETLDLIEAEGRVLAKELFSPEFVPSFDNSSMDGFAVNSASVKPGENSFRVVKQIIAGDQPLGALGVRLHLDMQSGIEEFAIEMMTGAPMPNGFNAVVKVEDTISTVNEKGERFVQIKGPVEAGQFVREIGEDFQKGNLIATPGMKVDSKLLMSAAAAGLSRVSVFRKPKVWVIATGREVVEYSAPTLTPGEIRNSSSPYLVNELKRLGCEVSYQGIIKDDVAEFEACVKAALSEKVDLIISTGAVSMGVHDFIKDSVEKLGGVTNFHKVAIRPGKPLLFCDFPEHPNTVFFGLPGNPISTAVGVQFFVKPYLNVIFQTHSDPVFARLAKPVVKHEGLRCFFKAHWFVDQDGVSKVEVLDGQASFMVHSLLKANAWVVLPEDSSQMDVGTVLEICLLGC